MGRVVVDTSVMFKWCVAYGEPGLDEAWSLLRQHQAGTLTLNTPTLALLELANVLSYSGIAANDARAFLTEFERAHVVTFELTPARIRLAMECAYTHHITVYDASFLVLAQELDCPLFTADRRAFGSIPQSVAVVRLVL